MVLKWASSWTHPAVSGIQKLMAIRGKLFLIFLTLALFTYAGRAQALDPVRNLDQLHHTAWTIRDGAPPDIWALAQSPDGFLWLGTGAGLYRFDGVRFEKFKPVGSDTMPSSNINALYSAPDGDIWIGYNTGHISRLHSGRLTTVAVSKPDGAIVQIVPGLHGTLWAAIDGVWHGGLAHYANGRWAIAGPELGRPKGLVTSAFVARDGALWLAAGRSLAVLGPDAQRFQVVATATNMILGIGQSADATIWVTTMDGVPLHRVLAPAGHAPSVKRLPMTVPHVQRMLFDRDGVLWGTVPDAGVFRFRGAVPVAAPRSPATVTPERLMLRDGLSSDLAKPILEDREGNIWVGTNLGLDRFRATNAVAAPGLPATSQQGFRATRGEAGAVYVTTGDALFRAYPNKAAERVAPMQGWTTFLYTDRAGTVWAEFDGGLKRLVGRTLTPVNLSNAFRSRVSGWLQDKAGKICISVLNQGIFCQQGDRWVSGAPQHDSAQFTSVELAYDRDGRTWLNYEWHLAMLEHGVRKVFAAKDGLTIGNISIVSPGLQDVFVGGDFGLARFRDGHFQTLRSDQHPMLSRISGIVETADGDLWVNAITGVIKITRSDLAEAFAHPDQAMRESVFNLDDGLPGVAQQDSHSPTAIGASDGRLWFITGHGVAWIDPKHLVQNALAPPVVIRALISGGKEYGLRGLVDLPEGASNLQVDYTALSLSIPERVRFRYKLEGVDAEWIDPGTRRQAFYTGLGPGTYRFQVIAANNDGVWNRTGATLTFRIAPTFVQSFWFKALVALSVLAIIALLYSLRIQQLASRMQLRLEERLGERERIARELHDTLLQGFQGLIYRFQAIMEQLPTGLAVRETMGQALDRADAALAEGRDRVSDLRTGSAGDDLSQAFIESAARMSSAASGAFRVIVEGRYRPLHPIVQEEVVRIGDEAIANALLHAEADIIEVSITYHAREFRVHFRDNGVGIPVDIMESGGRQRHFGMAGMRERADKIGSSFHIASRLGGGTEITLIVPAASAYAASIGRRWWLPRRKAPSKVYL